MRCYTENNQLTNRLKGIKEVFALLEVSGLSFHYQPQVPVLTAIGGTGRVFGFNDLTCAKVSDRTLPAAIEHAKQKGFMD